MSLCTRREQDQENLIPQPIKGDLQSSKFNSNTNRLALGEVGNKVHKNIAPNVQEKAIEVKPQQVGAIKKKHIPLKKTVVGEVIPKIQNEKINVKSKTNAEIKKLPVKYPDTFANFVSIDLPLSYSTKQLLDIIDVDTSDNPLHVSHYVQDIYKYLLELEDKFSIEKNFLNKHKSTPHMRTVLVNWLVEVHVNFKLLLETLHLTVAIIDRYLQSNKQISGNTLQLVGTAAMWISGKYEDIYILDISDLVYICDNTFSKKQFLEMECDILKKLDFNLGRPLSLQFLRRFNKIAGATFEQHSLGKYILELSLINYDICYVKPSLQAAAACCLAIGILNDLLDPSKVWTDLLVHYSTYTFKEIKPLLALMANAINKADVTKYKSIHTKYSSTNFSKISLNPKLKGPLMKKLITEFSNSTKK
ncbi:cyclin [Holotrichia oblita]|uniref:Cyclin n=1 Tax=Holotrichia oblita TaxID=644536 RepID=A0ACB9TN22_HOLOL|nr:cyclin [Holotrichia oblita]